MRIIAIGKRYQTVLWIAQLAALVVIASEIGFSEDRAEQLVSHNQPPTFQTPQDASLDFEVVLPSNYDWREQERIMTCIRNIYAQLDDSAIFSAVVEHMFDPRYCVSIRRLSTRENLTVGAVCCEILRSRAQEFIVIPSNRKPPMEAFPFQMGDRDLLAWYRKHKTASLMDVQLESISGSKAMFEKLAQRANDAKKPIPEYIQEYLRHLEKLRHDITERSKPIPITAEKQGVVLLSGRTVFQFESEFLLAAEMQLEISKKIDSNVATDGPFGAAVYLQMPQPERMQKRFLKSIKGPVLDLTDSETARLWKFDPQIASDETSRSLRLMIASQAAKHGYYAIEFASPGYNSATVAVIVPPAERKRLSEEE